MALDTKLNLNNNRFEQPAGDELNLSGTTNYYGFINIPLSGELNLQKGIVLENNVLTTDASGNSRWAEVNKNIPAGLEGEVIFYQEDNTKNFTHGYSLEYATVVENDAELDTATGITPSFEEVFNTWELFSHWYAGSGYTAMDETNFSPYYPYKENPLGLVDPPTYEEQTPNYPALDPNNSTQPLTQSLYDSGDFWGYDATNDRIFLTKNFNPYTGFISNDKYDRYSNRVTLSSTDNDDDIIGLIIAFVTDEETGFEYSLSVYRQYNPSSILPTYGIVFNFAQNPPYNDLYNPDFDYVAEDTIIDGSSLVSTSGSDWYIAGQTIMEVIRDGDIITTRISQQGGTSIDTGTTLQIDLKEYSKLQRFRGPSKLGFSAKSQEDAYFSDLQLSVLGNYIFYLKNDGLTHDTYEYDNDTSAWFLQNPQSVTLYDYIGYGRFTYSNLFEKTYYINGDGSVIKPMTGGILSTGDAIRREISQVNHGFSVGDFVGWSGGTYNKAIADGTYDGEYIGLIDVIIDADTFYVTQTGYVTGLSGLTANTTYYLSPTTAGEITETEPTTDGHISKAILIANSSTSGWILPYIGVVVSSGATIISTADNGLTDNSGVVELGGDLIRNTVISGLTTYNLEFNGGLLNYSADYTTGITAREIPDAGWVTGYTSWDNLLNKPTTLTEIDSNFFGRFTWTTTDLDWSDERVRVKTLTANETWTFSNLTAGKRILLEVTGNFAITYPTYVSNISATTYDGTLTNYIILYCINATSTSENVLLEIIYQE